MRAGRIRDDRDELRAPLWHCRRSRLSEGDRLVGFPR